MSEQKQSVLTSPTFKGLIPWVLILVALIVLQKTVDYRIVSKGRDVAGLEDNTLYYYTTTPALCENEVVYVAREGRRYLVTIAVVAGQSLTATNQDRLISLYADTLGEAWQSTARADLAAMGSETIPEGHVLLVNSTFDGEDERRNWAVAVVPNTDIRASLSHVLFSRNFARIGQPAKHLGTCAPQAT